MTTPFSSGSDDTNAGAATPLGALRDAAVSRQFRVRVSPIPTIIEDAGDPVPKAQVLEILFPGDTVSTPLGPRNVVADPGAAKILVGDITIRGVSLC